jgi:hypothetical protein
MTNAWESSAEKIRFSLGVGEKQVLLEARNVKMIQNEQAEKKRIHSQK